VRAAALNVGRGIRWYLRELTGEAKWDQYLQGCLRENIEPMSRRHFERHRAEQMENTPLVRCC